MNYVFVCYVITFLTTAVFNSRLTGYPGTEQRAAAPSPPLPLVVRHSLPSRELASTLAPSIRISVTLQDHIMSPPVPSILLRINCRRLPLAAKVPRARVHLHLVCSRPAPSHRPLPQDLFLCGSHCLGSVPKVPPGWLPVCRFHLKYQCDHPRVSQET